MSKYILLKTSSSWFSCNINLWTGLDQFPGRLEVYEDKLGQSEDRILSSHITNNDVNMRYSLDYLEQFIDVVSKRNKGQIECR